MIYKTSLMTVVQLYKMALIISFTRELIKYIHINIEICIACHTNEWSISSVGCWKFNVDHGLIFHTVAPIQHVTRSNHRVIPSSSPGLWLFNVISFGRQSALYCHCHSVIYHSLFRLIKTKAVAVVRNVHFRERSVHDIVITFFFFADLFRN